MFSIAFLIAIKINIQNSTWKLFYIMWPTMFQNVHYAFNVKFYTQYNTTIIFLWPIGIRLVLFFCYQNKFKTNAIHTLKTFYFVLFIIQSYLFSVAYHLMIHIVLKLKFANQSKQAAVWNWNNRMKQLATVSYKRHNMQLNCRLIIVYLKHRSYQQHKCIPWLGVCCFSI